MSYFKDLTFYSYNNSIDINKAINIGWLEKSQPYTKGTVPEKFVQKLWDYTKIKVLMMRGFHKCEFCDSLNSGSLEVKRGEEVVKLGYAQIRVFGDDGKIYASPNLIYHYITVHGYKPPHEFIKAVINGVDASSVEYLNLLKNVGFNIEYVCKDIIVD